MLEKCFIYYNAWKKPWKNAWFIMFEKCFIYNSRLWSWSNNLCGLQEPLRWYLVWDGTIHHNYCCLATDISRDNEAVVNCCNCQTQAAARDGWVSEATVLSVRCVIVTRVRWARVFWWWLRTSPPAAGECCRSSDPTRRSARSVHQRGRVSPAPTRRHIFVIVLHNIKIIKYARSKSNIVIFSINIFRFIY